MPEMLALVGGILVGVALTGLALRTYHYRKRGPEPVRPTVARAQQAKVNASTVVAPFLVNNGVLYVCPECGGWFPFRNWTGKDGIGEHIIREHPHSSLAQDVRAIRASRSRRGLYALLPAGLLAGFGRKAAAAALTTAVVASGVAWVTAPSSPSTQAAGVPSIAAGEDVVDIDRRRKRPERDQQDREPVEPQREQERPGAEPVRGTVGTVGDTLDTAGNTVDELVGPVVEEVEGAVDEINERAGALDPGSVVDRLAA